VILVITLIAAGFLWLTQPAKVEPDPPPGNAAPRTPSATDPETGAVLATAEDQAIVMERSVVEAAGATTTKTETAVLRVILEGIAQEDARRATVTVTGVEVGDQWPGANVQDTWPCQGLTGEYDLDRFFARVAERLGNLRDDELVVEVDHPLHFSETTRVPLSRGVKRNSGQTVYEARVRLAEVVFWPELTLAVRDVHTRAHLNDVELRCVPTAFMGLWQVPGTAPIFTSLGDGQSSPIVLLGGRKAEEPEDRVAGLAFRPAAGGAPRPAELVQPEETERGVMVYARAPGYSWGRIVLDVSTGAERELLLEPAAALVLRFANVQLEGYATLEKEATLCVRRVGPDGGVSDVWFQRLDQTLETEGLRLEALQPGELAVSVELGGAMSWRKRPVLVREKFSLAAGETRELLLVLADSPVPPERATLGGVVSFPAFGGEEEVRLELYQADYRYGDADFELALADMEHAFSALPTWSFRLEDLPVGRYQVRLLPFEKSWMIELPTGGREDVELVVPELAEVFVETVDARTGERIPLEVIRYGSREDLPGRVHHDWSSIRNMAAFEDEPGRFRFWTVPGAAYVATYNLPSELNLGIRRLDLELVPGLQSLRFELAPACTLHFEFRVNGAALPRDDGIFTGLSRGIRAIGHEGRVGTVTYWLLQASAPGLYEISFEGIGADRFLPIQPRRVEVRAGETTEVIVDLRRK
jgi:hypothetical protein